MSLNPDGGRAGTPDSQGSRAPSLAGGLAEALRARQMSMQGASGGKGEEDW